MNLYRINIKIENYFKRETNKTVTTVENYHIILRENKAGNKQERYRFE